MISFFISTLLCVAAVQAFPNLFSRGRVSSLTRAQIDAFNASTHFAAAAYCNQSATLSWDCGAHCASNPGFQPIASGGDGDGTYNWYVGYDPSLETVIVAHRGSNTTLSILTDRKVDQEKLDPTLFPGLSKRITVHPELQDMYAMTAEAIRSNVTFAMSNYSTKSVTFVGHSTGGAVALLDAISMRLHMPHSHSSFRVVTYGLPRVGNKAFAKYVDTAVELTHINNKKDPIPTVPARSAGYVQPSGEVHIVKHGRWESCPGHDNLSKKCSVAAVPTVSSGEMEDHDGPYNEIMMNCEQ